MRHVSTEESKGIEPLRRGLSPTSRFSRPISTPTMRLSVEATSCAVIEYREEDSNPHAFRPRFLRPLCLPIPSIPAREALDRAGSESPRVSEVVAIAYSCDCRCCSIAVRRGRSWEPSYHSSTMQVKLYQSSHDATEMASELHRQPRRPPVSQWSSIDPEPRLLCSGRIAQWEMGAS